MRVEFCEDRAAGLDIAAPARWRIAVTTQPKIPVELALLTDGQRDCLRLVYQHLTSKDIARILGVSPHTVDMRLRTAMRTLSVASRIEAARLLVNEDIANGLSGDVLPEGYQPLIYHAPDVAPGPETLNLASPASNGSDDSAHHDHLSRFSPDVGLPASGPPRLAGTSVPFEAYPPSWTGAAATDPGIGTRSLSNLRPWGKKNDLGIGVRLGWIFFIAMGSALTFGAILAALASLKTLL
jgi:DNA-binding CsgD family transcriptional regulator